MIEESVLSTIAAASDTILGGSSSAGVHKGVAEFFDLAMQGFPSLAAGLLDAFAADVKAGATFVELTDEERGQVFKTMLAEESIDIRDIVDGLFIFTLGQNYDETHPDHKQIWERIGYPGPSIGKRFGA